MRTILLAAVIAFAGSAEKPRIITVTGCLNGASLRATKVDTSGTYIDRFRLKGSKEAWKTFAKEHQGHEVEVTGALRDPSGVMGGGTTKELGKKTKIHVTNRPRPNVPSAGATDPLIEVQSFRYVQDTCRTQK